MPNKQRAASAGRGEVSPLLVKTQLPAEPDVVRIFLLLVPNSSAQGG